MNLRHDVMAGRPVRHDAVLDDADGDGAILDDELFADELAGVVEMAAAFLASADAAALASAFTAFTCGIYSLDKLRADLWGLGAWIRGNA